MSERYSGKQILAPMVRISTLPMRLLALDYGADLVYCEEIIDRKILSTTRTENAVLGTIDYTMSDGTVVFRTCSYEKNKVIFQLGTSDAKRALAAAHKVEKDVAGIDINMGCPKEFSIKGGMGCALLCQPEKIKEILTTLVEGLSIPVTCKIRVLPELEDTLNLAKLIQSTGVTALAVHGRTKEERPQHRNRNHVIKAIAETLTIPVIANGGSKEIFQFEDLEKFRRATGASSVMIGRQAEWNCSIFHKQGRLPLYDVVKAYLIYAFKYDNNDINTKYCVLQMMHEDMDTPEGQGSLTVKTNEEISIVWGMQSEYQQSLQDRKCQTEMLQQLSADDHHGFKRRKTSDGHSLIELPIRFDRKCYQSVRSPKQSLHEWCYRCNYNNPEYITMDIYVVKPTFQEENAEDRSFNSRVLVDGKWYTTPFWEKRKQYAEQAAAMCCLLTHGIDDGRIKEPSDQTPELRLKWHQLAKSQNHCTDGAVSEDRLKANESDVRGTLVSENSNNTEEILGNVISINGTGSYKVCMDNS